MYRSAKYLHRYGVYYNHRFARRSAEQYKDIGWLNGPPDLYSLHSTPLDESLIAMDLILAKFKNDYKTDKVVLVCLTDGGANGMRSGGDLYLKLGKKYVSCDGYYASRYDSQKLSTTGRLISWLKKKHGIKAVGFFIVRRYKDLHWHFHCPYNKQLLAKKTFNKDKCLADINTAYDKYFYIKSDMQVKETDLSTINDSMKKNKIKTIFANSMKERLISRVLLQKFIKEVA